MALETAPCIRISTKGTPRRSWILALDGTGTAAAARRRARCLRRARVPWNTHRISGLLLLQPGREDRLGGAQRLREHHFALAAVLPLGEQQVRVLAAGLELMPVVELDDARDTHIAGLLERLDDRIGVGAARLLDRFGVDVHG